MKIIDGGNEILGEFDADQMNTLKRLVLHSIENTFEEDEKIGGGYMMFSDTESIFGYSKMYVEFFFDRNVNMEGVKKVILYDGDEPDEVLDAMNELTTKGKGLKKMINNVNQ